MLRRADRVSSFCNDVVGGYLRRHLRLGFGGDCDPGGRGAPASVGLGGAAADVRRRGGTHRRRQGLREISRHAERHCHSAHGRPIDFTP